MAEETVLQHWIFTRFIFPFLLIFVLVYAVLEKTNIFGQDKHQVNAITALVIGLIFVTVLYPTTVLNNMILFLTISLIVVFVALLLWGFITGNVTFPDPEKPAVKWIVGVVIILAVGVAVLWATGVSDNVIDFLFKQGWSDTFWTNFLFILVIGIALAFIIRSSIAKNK
jgi:hypothetical protein